MYYNDLTVNSWINLDPNWYAIYVKWTLTLNSTSKIIRNGNAGGNGWNGTVGSWATALNTGTCWPCAAGVASVLWAWNPGVSINPSYANATWAQWWMDGVWGVWWVWGTSVRWPNYYPFLRISKLLEVFTSPSRALAKTTYGWLPGAWSWATYSGSNSFAWWSGWGGWIIFIYANAIAGTGTVEAKWGNGGNWYTTSWQYCGGGGGWGSGWVVCILYHTGTLWTITVTWWAWWAWWVGSWWGASGGAGWTGTTGISITLQV